MTVHPPPSPAGPQMVFIHGAGSNADFWHRQHAAFPQAHYLNLPGHVPLAARLRGTEAESLKRFSPQAQPSALSARPSIEGYADWVDKYVHEKGLDDVTLDGHSMGGAIALTLALRQPVWLKGLVLTGTGARLRVSPRLLELLRGDYAAAVDMIVRKSLPPLSEEPLTYRQVTRRNSLRRHLLRAPQSVTLADYEASEGFDVTARLGEIGVPTLCIVGALDRITPPSYSAYLHKEIGGAARLEVVEGAGHMLPLEKPEEYNEAVKGFLEHVAHNK